MAFLIVLQAQYRAEIARNYAGRWRDKNIVGNADASDTRVVFANLDATATNRVAANRQIAGIELDVDILTDRGDVVIGRYQRRNIVSSRRLDAGTEKIATTALDNHAVDSCGNARCIVRIQPDRVALTEDGSESSCAAARADANGADDQIVGTGLGADALTEQTLIDVEQQVLYGDIGCLDGQQRGMRRARVDAGATRRAARTRTGDRHGFCDDGCFVIGAGSNRDRIAASRLIISLLDGCASGSDAAVGTAGVAADCGYQPCRTDGRCAGQKQQQYQQGEQQRMNDGPIYATQSTGHWHGTLIGITALRDFIRCLQYAHGLVHYLTPKLRADPKSKNYPLCIPYTHIPGEKNVGTVNKKAQSMALLLLP